MNERALYLPACLLSGHPIAMAADAFSALLLRLQSRIGQLDSEEMNRRHPAERFARTSHKYAVTRDGNAVISLKGVMLPEADWLWDAFCEDYTVTPHFAAAVREAGARDDVQAITIEADSPGGVVFGLQAAYEAIRDCPKQVTVAVTGMMASAALYVAAAADHIVADPAAIVGSIGTLTTVTDMSQMAAKLGITVHLIASGEHKGTGTPGVPITADKLKPYQELVDQLASQFRAVVAEGRGLSAEAVQVIATGEAWVATRAQELGLVDETNPTPLVAASTANRKALMLTKDQYKSLCNSHPEHRALIDKMDGENKSEAEIKAAIAGAINQGNIDRVKALEQELADTKAQHATALKAEQDAHEKTKADLTASNEKLAKLQALKPGHGDPGADDPSRKAKAPDPVSLSAFNAMSAEQRTAFMDAGGSLLPESAPTK